MNLIVGFLNLFILLGPLYVGATTIEAFCFNRKKPLCERICVCRNLKMLAVSISLLVLVPAQFVYSVLTHDIPDGKYELAVPYRLSGLVEQYDYDNDTFREVEVDEEGTALLTVSVYNDVDYVEGRENFYGYSSTKKHYYMSVYPYSVLLDCFKNEIVGVGDNELEENRTADFEIEYDGNTYQLMIQIGELTDKSLGYTIEDRINDISRVNLIECGVLMLLVIIGIGGFFAAEYVCKKE